MSKGFEFWDLGFWPFDKLNYIIFMNSMTLY